MSRTILLDWTDNVLFQFTRLHSNSTFCLVFDFLSIHLDEQYKSKLANEKIKLLYIPGGLTGLLQPVRFWDKRSYKDWLTEDVIDNPEFNNLIASDKKHRLSILFNEI